MSRVIEAIYRKGALKPIKPLNFKEGEKVRVEIKENSSTNLSKLLQKYIIESDTDLTEQLVKERR